MGAKNKIIETMACGYFKLEALDSERNRTIRFEFGAAQPEKMAKIAKKGGEWGTKILVMEIKVDQNCQFDSNIT